MKKTLPQFKILICLILLFFSQGKSIYAQCTNADFEDGNFNGWTGTYSSGQCVGILLLGICGGCSNTNPLNSPGFNQGPLNDPSTDITTQYNQVLTSTAGGNDANLTNLGYTLPVVWPGSGSYSARIGSMWQTGGTNTGDGETMSYSFVVTPSNCNFTYHYAVVLNDGGHGAGEQPYFNIAMTDGGGNPITCANYEVDATTAQTIGGFITAAPAVFYKPWTSVFIPLNNYMGQTVKITFTTRSCLPAGCAGGHYAYAYLDAECGPLALVASSPTVCGGQNVTLTAPAGAATYQWVGPGVVPPGNTQVVTINQPGHYTVNMTTFGNVPCNFSLDTIIAAAPGNPSASFTATGTCAGSPTTFTDNSTPAGSLTAWAWDFNNDGVTDATTQNGIYTFATAGTYPVKLTVTWPPCMADTVINVVISDPPTSPFTATSPVCLGTDATITYTGNGAVGDTYTWNFDGGTIVSGSGQGPYSVNWSTGGTKNITLTVAVGNCISSVTTVQVVVNPFPGITVSPNTTICVGGNTILTAAGGTTYTWTPATGLSATTGPTVTATPAITTTYTVTGVTANCTSPASVTVTVAPIPTSTFTTTSPVCAGVNSTITYTGNAPANATYTWNFAGGTVVSGSGQGPYQVNWPTGGTPNITLSVTVGTCVSPVTTVPVTVNALPVVTVSPDVTICTGGNTTLTAAGAATYVWAPATGLNATTGATVTSTPASTITYAVTGTTAGCSDSASVTVTVAPIPTSPFTVTSPVCTGVNSTITYTGNAAANATYTWNFAGGTVASGSGQGPYQVNWSTAGTPNITLMVSLGTCASPVTAVPVTVNPSPVVTVSPDVAICNGGNAVLTAGGAATYVWSPSTGLSTTSNNSVTATPASTITYTVSGTTAGCSDSASVTVTVNAIPTSTFTATSPICTNQNTPIVYTGNASVNATYTWDFAGGNVSVAGSGQGPYRVNWPTAGTENIGLTVTENGCTSNSTVPVVVNDVPVSNAGPDVSFCSGNNALIGTAATAGYTYSWSPATGLSNATVANPTANMTNTNNAVSTTNYIVTTYNANCSSTDTVVVTVYPVPVASFIAPAGQCLTANSFTYQAGGTFLPNATFAWDFSVDGTPANSTSQNQVVSFDAVGSYPVSLTITQNGCVSNTFTAPVDIYPIPAVGFQPDSLIGCENFQVCFTNFSTGNNPTYQWNFGDGGISTAQNPCHTFVAPGVYSIGLKITSNGGCSADTLIPNMITVVANPKAMFTPSSIEIQLPRENTINLENQSQNAFTYFWTFGKAGSSTAVNPTILFTDSGTYPIMLYAYNQLGCPDSVMHPVIVLPPTNFFIPNAFTPNGDGNNDEFYIESQEGVRVISFKVFNRLGEMVHEGNYPWTGNYKGKPAPEGVYIYLFDLGLAGDVMAIHRKGSVTLIR